MAKRVTVAELQEMGRPSDPSQDDEATTRLKELGYGDTGLTQARVYDVDTTGEVRDWRRPDTTPDRGDVTATHTLTDQDPKDNAFLGVRSDEKPEGESDATGADLYAVPSDQQFNGKLYRDSPDLANIAEKLIGEHGHLSELINCEIRYFWKRKTGVSKGRVKIGYCKRASDLLGHFTGADFIVWLSATTARDGKFTPRQVEAAIFHQLCHIETDDEGNFITARHDFEGFAAEIRHYGTWTEDLKLGGTAFVAAHQMGLFDNDDADEEGAEDGSDLDCRNCGGTVSMERPLTGGLCEACLEEQAEEAHRRDGAGVLIHADGTALTDDEILADPAVI